MLSIVISSAAVAFAILKFQGFRSLRYVVVLFALGAGQIYLAITAFSLLLLVENKFRLPYSVPRTPIFVAVILFLSIVSLTMASNVTWRTVSELAQLLIYVFLFFQLVDVLRSSERVFFLMRSSVFAALAVAILGIFLANAGLTQSPHIFLNRGSNEGSTFLLLMGVVPAVALFLRNRSLVYLLFALVMVYAQFIAMSRANIAISLICLASTVFFIWKVVWIRVLSLLVIFGVFVSSLGILQDIYTQQENFSVRQRIALLEYGWSLWHERLWIGWGWGSTSILAPQSPLTELSFPHFHNTYIQLVVELGMLGAAIIISWLVYFIWLTLKSMFEYGNRMSMIYTPLACSSVFLSGLTEALVFGADRAVQVVMILAIIYRLNHYRRQRRYCRIIIPNGGVAGEK